MSEDRGAEAITNIVSKVVDNFNEARSKLVGQTYDGASVMAGDISGVKTRIMAIYPMAFFTHCYAHRLQLILLNGTKIPEVKRFFSHLNSFHAFFSKSPKRMTLLQETYKISNMDGNFKKPIAPSETRWNFKERAVSVILELYEVLIKVFDAVSEWHNDHEAITLANGLKYVLSEFSFVFLLCVYSRIFDICGFLFSILQAKHSNIPTANKHIMEVSVKLSNLRSDEAFGSVYERAVKICGEPKDKRGYDKNKWKGLFYSVLDHVTTQIENRFNDFDKLNFFALLDNNEFKNYRRQFPNNLINSLTESYPIFEKEKLSSELKVLWNSDELNVSQNILLKKIKELDISGSFDQVFRLATLMSTLSVTSSSVERSFSCLKRIKSYLRTTMSDERLNDLAKMSIEKELIVSLCEHEILYDEAIRYFLQKERKLKLQYK